MGFLRRLLGSSEPAERPARRNPALSGLTKVSDVVPVPIDPRWPVIPPEPIWSGLSTEARNSLPFLATTCPNCGVEVTALPKGRKKCTACGSYMFVCVVDGTHRQLATEDDAAVLNAREGERAAADHERAAREWLALVRAAGVTVADQDEDMTIDVVGESHHHADLAGLMATLRSGNEREVYTVAALVREPTNKYDRNAIQVVIHGRHVGYISRDDAEDMQPWLKRRDRNGTVFVIARLGGGIAEDGYVGPIGVTLEQVPDIYSENPTDGIAQPRRTTLRRGLKRRPKDCYRRVISRRQTTGSSPQINGDPSEPVQP